MVFPLSKLADAFAAASRKDTYRVLVQPDEEYAASHQGKAAGRSS